MVAKYHQITLKDTFSDCQDMFLEDTLSFIRLLDNAIDISEFIPADFYHAFHLTLDIIRHIAFLDDAFKEAHPEISVAKKSDSPDEDKSTGDSFALYPVLVDYFTIHPQFSSDTFLGNIAFDTIETYGFLKDKFHFSKALIPYNVRNESTLPKVSYNIYGYPPAPMIPPLQ